MPNGAQGRAKSTRVTRKGDIRSVVVAENVVEEQLEPGLLGGVRFAHVGFPEGVILWEAGLKGVGGVGSVDVGF